jgi:hypothetical protein
MKVSALRFVSVAVGAIAVAAAVALYATQDSATATSALEGAWYQQSVELNTGGVHATVEGAVFKIEFDTANGVLSKEDTLFGEVAFTASLPYTVLPSGNLFLTDGTNSAEWSYAVSGTTLTMTLVSGPPAEAPPPAPYEVGAGPDPVTPERPQTVVYLR